MRRSARSSPAIATAAVAAAAVLAACSSSPTSSSSSSSGWNGDASTGSDSGEAADSTAPPVDGGARADGGDGGARPDASGSGDAGDAGSPVCTAQGTFCGGHGVTGDDPGTLYICGAAGQPPASSSKCLSGCQQNATPPDQCEVTDAGSGGVVCTGSAAGYYCGSDEVTGGDPSTLYDCPGKGLAPSSSQPCANGCQVEPAGTNDLCKGALVCPTAGDYCGGDMMGGDPNTLYHCTAGDQAPASSMPCANGCKVEPAGTNDVCSSSLSCPGSGAYCGGDGVQGGDASTLYNCPGAGQAPSSSQACANGCTIEPAGTPDFCAATGNCPGSGAYCGNDGLNGPSNVLYQCPGAGQAPSSNTVCSAGCVVEPAGTPDYCAGGGCSATGQAALNWEANQLNSGNSWSDYCLGFVNTAYKNAGQTLSYLQAATAADSLANAKATGSFAGWNGSCPCGGILYWAANSCNGEDGHVVICNGNGTVSTSGWPGFAGSTDASISWLSGEECGNTPAGYILP